MLVLLLCRLITSIKSVLVISYNFLCIIESDNVNLGGLLKGLFSCNSAIDMELLIIADNFFEVGENEKIVYGL